MKTKLFAIVTIAAFLASTVLFAVPVKATVLPDYKAVDGNNPLGGEVYLPTTEDAPYVGPMEKKKGKYKGGDTPPVGTTVYDWYLSAIGCSPPTMTLRAMIGKAEIWVADDLAYPEGDPRNEFPINWTVTDEMAEYLAQEFDDVIYPTDTSYFGMPLDRDGTNTIFQQMGWPAYTYDWAETTDPWDPQRTIIKVLNIRDENYDNPDYPYFVIGFFSSTYTGYYNRNIIHIDNWQWWRRLGEEGHEWYPEFPWKSVERPYTYEGTVAHEYQHLIHADWNPAGPSFMNEGCSMYAEILCGYGVSWGHVNSYLYTPDNSLTEWGDQGDINILADYGAATLWAVYLSDHYGGPAILSRYVEAGIPGIEGVNAALGYLGYTETFDDVYYDWRIANFIHKDDPGEGKYNYVSLDLGGAEATPAMTHPIPHRWTAGTDFGNTFTNLGYDTGVVELGAYGSDYIFTKYLDEPGELFFDGDDVAAFGWQLLEVDGRLAWYSDGVSLGNFLISTTIDVPTEVPVLTFDTKYDIEIYWDFGFVQVSTDGGATWTSLENSYTTYDHDAAAHPDIIASLPGLTGTSEGWPEWMTMSFALTDYAGQTVMLGFRYMTDWASLWEGWYVDNVRINDVAISNEAFEVDPPYPDADFFVTLLGVKKASPPMKLDFAQLVIEDADTVDYLGEVPLDDDTETGTFDVSYTQEYDYLVLIVSPDRGPVDYVFKFDYSG